ncbi:hypothetical protein [Paenibacillus sp. 22594]|uniref:hypothetical protein n=1 Tax=Paenibacillus sp. 22594 TaxID=3453947 RepID=UPI003F85AC32
MQTEQSNGKNAVVEAQSARRAGNNGRNAVVEALLARRVGNNGRNSVIRALKVKIGRKNGRNAVVSGSRRAIPAFIIHKEPPAMDICLLAGGSLCLRMQPRVTAAIRSMP